MLMNVYSRIGMVLPVGLAAKDGILIVEFAGWRRATRSHQARRRSSGP